jgi:quinol monooxygenase YgiN
MSTVIDTGTNPTTLVNVFTVAPERQQELVDLLAAATDDVMRHRPGFVSANIHRSLDGTRVVNYAQWRTVADFETMLADPAARAHMAQAYGIASSVEPHLYEVVSVHR